MLLKEGLLVRVTLLEEIKGLYTSQPPGGIYYGVVFDDDPEHLTIKSFRYDKDKMVFGFIDRFMHDDIKIEWLNGNFQFEEIQNDK